MLDRQRTQQLEAVVVDRDAEGIGGVAREPPCEQARQSDVRGTPGERVHEKMLPFLGDQPLDQERLRRRQARQLQLRFEHRTRRLDLGVGRRFAACEARQHVEHRIGKFARQRHLRAGPARHAALGLLGALDIRGHVLRANVFEQPAREDEAVARAQPRDETFLDAADAPARQPRHVHRRVADDGADLHPMAPRDGAVGHAVQAIDERHAVVFGIRAEARATHHHEVERPLELGLGEVAVRVRRAQLGIQRIGLEAAAERDRDEVLNQHVQRLVGRRALLDPPSLRGMPRCRRLDQFERIRRHQRDPARAPRRMAAAPGALQQARDTLGRADLQHPLDRQEVDAEVERRGRDDRLQPPFLQPEFDPRARRLVERAVVQRDEAGPLGALLQQQLIPDLGLRTHVDEDERRGRLLDLLDDRLLHLLAQMPAPREAAGVVGQQRIDDKRLVDLALHQRAAVVATAMAEQHLHRITQIAERRTQPPHRERRVPVPDARERELHLHAALVAHQLVPLVDDDGVHAFEFGARVLARQHQRERFGCGDERARKAPVLPRALGRWRIAGALAHGPRKAEVGQRQRDRPHRVGRERAHRRQPQHPERRRLALLRGADGRCAQQRAEPHRIGLARAGARMQQAAAPGTHRGPDLALECERCPAAGGEPGAGVE